MKQEKELKKIIKEGGSSACGNTADAIPCK